MDSTKPWYTSSGVWASILQVTTGIAVAVGGWDSGAAQLVVTEAPAYLVGVAVGALGLWSLWGRVTAVKKIG